MVHMICTRSPIIDARSTISKPKLTVSPNSNRLIPYHKQMMNNFLLLFAIVGTATADTLLFTAIPDQLNSTLFARAEAVTNLLENYIGEKCDVDVKVQYNPVANYQDAVDALVEGVADFGWYGGLTGVQAGLRSPPSIYLTQRIEDTQFTSVFIQQEGMELMNGIDDVENRSLAFGSVSSTSGHLMPAYYIGEAGVNQSSSIFTGSHDATVDAVIAGTVEVGALNSIVWASRLAANTTNGTSVFYTTPEFVDYLWVAGEAINDKWASIIEGSSSSSGCEDINALITEAFLSANGTDPLGAALFEAYSTKGYVNIKVGEYDPIEETGCALDLIETQYCDEPIPENLGNVNDTTIEAEEEEKGEDDQSDPPVPTPDINEEGGDGEDPCPTSLVKLKACAESSNAVGCNGWWEKWGTQDAWNEVYVNVTNCEEASSAVCESGAFVGCCEEELGVSIQCSNKIQWGFGDCLLMTDSSCASVGDVEEEVNASEEEEETTNGPDPSLEYHLKRNMIGVGAIYGWLAYLVM